MAFQPQNFSRVSKSANEDIVNIQDTTKTDPSGVRLFYDVQGCFRKYNYLSKTYPAPTQGQAQASATGDSLGAILTWPAIVSGGAGYFDAVANDLQVGDLIEVYSFIDSAYTTFAVTAINSSSPKVVLGLAEDCKGVRVVTSAQILALVTSGASTPLTLIKGGSTYGMAMNALTASIAVVVSATKSAYANGAALTFNYSDGSATNSLYAASFAATLLTAGTGQFITSLGKGLTSAQISGLAGYDIHLACGTTAFTLADATKTANPLSLSYNFTIYPFI